MALSELWEAIANALNQMNNATMFDVNVANQCISQIIDVLLQNQFNDIIVQNFIANITTCLQSSSTPISSVMKEVRNMYMPLKPLYTVKRGEQSVVLFVGLPGSGKTTSC